MIFNIEDKGMTDARYISYKERKNAPSTDFVDEKNRSFPIRKAEDIPAAVHSWGRYKGNMSFEEFKKRLTDIAKRKGWESHLPKDWKNGSDKK